MKMHFGLAAALAVLMPAMMLGQGPQSGYWRAKSDSAKQVTGDIQFWGEKLTMNFFSTPIAEIRDLKPSEVSSVFDVDVNSAGPGKLFRVDIPASRTFLHKSHLCGDEPTEWVAAYVQGRTLQIAMFSGLKMPVFTFDAMAQNSNRCGTYTYQR